MDKLTLPKAFLSVKKPRILLPEEAEKLAFLDETGVTDKRSMQIYGNWDDDATDMDKMFVDDKTTKYFPKVDTSKVTTAVSAFQRSDFEYFPQLDFSSLTNIDFMFDNSKIRELPLFDFSRVTSAQCTFAACNNLTAVPPLDFSKVRTTGWGLFMYCSNLRTVAKLDFSSCTTLENCFRNCPIESFEPFVAPKVPWTAVQMFSDCTMLTEAPDIDFSNCINMQSTFSGAKKIQRLGAFSTGNVTTFFQTANMCTVLRTIESLDLAKATNMRRFVYYCFNLRFMKLLNLGQQKSIETTDAFYYAYRWGADSEENRQSLVDSLLTYSFDRTAAGYPALAIQLRSEVLARLTDAEKAAITAKGFTLTSY